MLCMTMNMNVNVNRRQVKAGGITGASRYNEVQRKAAIQRYRSKRDKRDFSKRIKYPSRSRQATGQRRVRGRFARRDEDEVEGVVELRNHYQVVFGSELGDELGYGFSDESHPLDTYNYAHEYDSAGHWVRQIQQEDWCSFINFDAFPL